MKFRIYLLFLVFLAINGAFAQNTQWIDPGDSAFNERYARIPFGERFAINILKSDGKNYFLIDLSKLPSRFERVYFMSLAFKQDKLVNIDPEITRDRIWFFAYEQYPVSEIEELFVSLKDRSCHADTTFSEMQKREWLLKNDKYK